MIEPAQQLVDPLCCVLQAVPKLFAFRLGMLQALDQQGVGALQFRMAQQQPLDASVQLRNEGGGLMCVHAVILKTATGVSARTLWHAANIPDVGARAAVHVAQLNGKQEEPRFQPTLQPVLPPQRSAAEGVCLPSEHAIH